MGHRNGARALLPLAPQALLTFVFTAVVSHASTNLLSNATYDVIGPFPLNVHVGGGEITASFGGVEAMRRNKSARFPSELGDGGQVGWMEAKPDAASGVVSLDFPWYREEFLAEALGLGAVADTVAWAATEVCTPAGRYRAMCSGASAFWIGGQEFVGDVYGLPIWSGESAWLRWPVQLPEGCRTLLVRTSQDFKCELEADDSGAKLQVQQEQQHSRFTPQLTLHLPDILEGRLVSHLLSFPVVNAHSSATTAVSVAVRSAALCADVPAPVAASRRLLASAPPRQRWTPPQLPQQPRFNTSLPQSRRRPASSLGAVMHGADRSGAVDEKEEDAARDVTMHEDVGLQRVCSPVPDISASLAAAVVLQPGQSVPLPVRLADRRRSAALQHPLQAAPCSSAGSGSLDVELEVRAGFEDGSSDTLLKTVSIACRPAGSAYTMTFRDVDGSVQTAAVRAPQDCSHLPAGCPIVLATHGAGVDSSSPVWTSSLPAAPHAWTLFPTNRGRYGFDWQGVGKLNALAAVHALASELPGVAPEQQPDMRVDSETVLFTGHSMGGHGCMVLSTHFPDKAVGAACAAGWIRYDHYVQEYQSPGTSFSDPFLQGLLKSAVAEYETDVMASNLRGVPFLARMGGNDDNVNPWNLRRFVRVLKQVNAAGEAVDTQCEVSEVPGKPHWWGQVMNGAPMPDFFRARLAAGKPPLPRTFTVHAASPRMGGRGGMRVLQQRRGFRLSKVHVSIDESGGHWTLRTQNVRRLGISRTESQPPLRRLTVDGTDLPAALLPEEHLCWAESDGAGAAAAWQVCQGTAWMQRERSAANCGPLAQAIEGPLLLVYSAQQPSTQPLAVGLANSLVARGRSLVRVVSDDELLSQPAALLRDRPNVVVIADPCSSPATSWAVGNSSLALTTAVGCDSGASWIRLGDASPFSGDGIGYMLLGQLWPGPSAAPTPWKGRGSRGLVVVVGGSGDAGVATAAHAFPCQAQAELPDYVVLGPDFAWQGQGGILAAGFWAHDWSIDATSRYP